MYSNETQQPTPDQSFTFHSSYQTICRYGMLAAASGAITTSVSMWPVLLPPTLIGAAGLMFSGIAYTWWRRGDQTLWLALSFFSAATGVGMGGWSDLSIFLRSHDMGWLPMLGVAVAMAIALCAERLVNSDR